jgi:hypothetical protein
MLREFTSLTRDPHCQNVPITIEPELLDSWDRPSNGASKPNERRQMRAVLCVAGGIVLTQAVIGFVVYSVLPDGKHVVNSVMC